MNPDTTPTPRTDEQIWTTEYHHELCDVVDKDFARHLQRELSEKTNEVARLKAGLEVMSKLYEEERADRVKVNNEVARLKELLNRAIEALENLNSGQAFVKPQVLRYELARLDPAPEEPETSANPDKCIGNVTETTIEGVTMDEWYGGFSKIESTEPTSEWRELGPALPKPKLTRASYDEDWNLKLKQEEIPLEADIENLEEIASSVPHGVATQRIAEKTANALRYLRDEIQKLKYNQEIYEDAGQAIINRIVKLESK